jgi:uncharacterized Zn-binding protein involved in type VI secretion
MGGVVRKGIDAAGGALLTGSPNVFVNNAPAVCVGASVAPHGKSPHSSAVMVSGSKNVFINNKPVCRAGDLANCGHKASGSSNVNVN